MEIFLICIGAYLLMGLGFTLAAWLQAEEHAEAEFAKLLDKEVSKEDKVKPLSSDLWAQMDQVSQMIKEAEIRQECLGG